jgi:hypothetical protein
MARTQVFGQAFRQAVGAHRPARMGVVDREVVGETLALGDPQRLRAGEMDDPPGPGGLGGQQGVPGAQHVDGHDLLRAARGVVGQGAEVDDRGTARRRPLHLAEVEKIITVGAIEADDLMAEAGQMLGHRGTYVAPVAGDENAHANHALARSEPVRPQGGVSAVKCQRSGHAAGSCGDRCRSDRGRWSIHAVVAAVSAHRAGRSHARLTLTHLASAGTAR